MNTVIIKKWNSKVKKTDTVFHLGDFGLTKSTEAPSAPKDTFKSVISQLNGYIILIDGNHDSNNSCKSIIESIVIKTGGFRIFCTHDPKYARENYPFNFCVTPDTKILTEEGWKHYNKLTIGEYVASYNINKKYVEYVPLLQINQFNYNGKMIKIGHKKLKGLFTPDHKIILNNGKIKLAKQLKTFDKIMLNTKIWKNRITTRLQNSYWAELIGFIIGDGSYCKWNDEIYAIRIAQKTDSDKTRTYLPNLLKHCHITYNSKPQKNGVTIFYISKNPNKKFINYIIKYCKYKKLTRHLLNLSQKQLSKLYDGLIMSDGHRREKQDALWQHNYADIELFEELIMKIGKRFSTSITKSGFKPKSKNYCILSSTQNFALLINHKNILKEQYNGKVWCPTTKNGTWIAKRNGNAFITGNCGHVHGKNGMFTKKGNTIVADLSVECTDYYPLNINEIMQLYSRWKKQQRTNNE